MGAILDREWHDRRFEELERELRQLRRHGRGVRVNARYRTSGGELRESVVKVMPWQQRRAQYLLETGRPMDRE